ncbi:glycosyltransferase family 4 protein [Methanothermococcus okinawensis]|uniref:Glycosyl transferase group 1 n=1 Tax=Methanothermococcus okinawensis (strain DSM 14208 / JCM 11175 / IH1) TaxID=647113 RepID=F8AMJ9_METOI|nr:glycosyltransferase family 4 protein [Methanothermococcus okinawensis]AEH06039.1 glycosyl transferase group 1 [Methanothermococcus okinawensis IH1]
MHAIKLIIFPGYYVPHIGGLETHVDEFVKYLSNDENYNIYIFAPNIPKYNEFEIRHNNVKIYRYPAFEIISNYPVPNIFSIKFWKMFFNLYNIDFDIVMTRTRFFSNTLLGFLFAKLRYNRKKLIHVEHGSAFIKVENEFTNKVAYFYDKIIGNIIFKKSDYVIAISKAVKKFIVENFIEDDNDNIPVIYRGLEIEYIDSIKESNYIKERFKNKIKLCFVGRLYKWKGVENIIKSYIALPQDIKEKTVLIIVGYGEDLQRLKKLSGEYLDNGIYFTGKKDFKDAIGIVKACDIYIHSSYKGGGLSSSLLQAMCCGKAIVASPYEGGDEVIIDGNTGVLLKDNSSELVKDGIIKLIRNKDLMEIYGKNAKKFINDNFDWGSSVEKYKKVFNKILQK